MECFDIILVIVFLANDFKYIQCHEKYLLRNKNFGFVQPYFMVIERIQNFAAEIIIKLSHSFW